MTADETHRSIRVIEFSGKEEDWHKWSKRFLAMATARGYLDVLIPVDIMTKQDANQNTLAYVDLTLACEEDVIFGIVDEATSTTFPRGDARIAWAGLKQRFEPDNGAMKVQMKSEFQQMKLLRAEDDPDPWITKVESLRRRLWSLGVTISDEDVILHILNNIPKEYATTIEICEEDLTGSRLTLQLLKDRIRAKFRRIQKEQMESSESIALMARSFKGMCNVCGIVGHKGADCFKLKKKQRKKEAFMKKRNENSAQHRKPNYNKAFRRENHQPTRDFRNQRDDSRNDRSTERDQDTAMMARYNGFMLIASKCEGIDSNTWIADTGASAHMTYNKSGFIDMKEDARQITIGDGSSMAIKQTGKWQGMITDKTGKQQLITLDEVCYVPDLKYNLMSLTKALKNGWELSGNRGAGVDR